MHVNTSIKLFLKIIFFATIFGNLFSDYVIQWLNHSKQSVTRHNTEKNLYTVKVESFPSKFRITNTQ